MKKLALLDELFLLKTNKIRQYFFVPIFIFLVQCKSYNQESNSKVVRGVPYYSATNWKDEFVRSFLETYPNNSAKNILEMLNNMEKNFKYIVQIDSCSSSMLSRKLILTAGHCASLGIKKDEVSIKNLYPQGKTREFVLKIEKDMYRTYRGVYNYIEPKDDTYFDFGLMGFNNNLIFDEAVEIHFKNNTTFGVKLSDIALAKENKFNINTGEDVVVFYAGYGMTTRENPNGTYRHYSGELNLAWNKLDYIDDNIGAIRANYNDVRGAKGLPAKGDSGSPVFNLDGNVVGVHVAKGPLPHIGRKIISDDYSQFVLVKSRPFKALLIEYCLLQKFNGQLDSGIC